MYLYAYITFKASAQNYFLTPDLFLFNTVHMHATEIQVKQLQRKRTK